MKHRLTRRRRHLKTARKTRRQRGGADAITSAKAWFDAVAEFEKGREFSGDYSFRALGDPSLTIPATVDKTLFPIPAINVAYPATNVTTPTVPVRHSYDLITLAQIVRFLFWGENDTGGILDSNVNTPSTFKKYVSDIKSTFEDTENKRTIWFLNEIETVLQQAAGNTRGFTSIYDTTELPFFIWYLAMNPITVEETQVVPVLSAVPVAYMTIPAQPPNAPPKPVGPAAQTT